MLNNPCKNCAERHAECHINCEDYNRYVVDNETHKEAIRRARTKDLTTVRTASIRRDNLKGGVYGGRLWY